VEIQLSSQARRQPVADVLRQPCRGHNRDVHLSRVAWLALLSLGVAVASVALAANPVHAQVIAQATAPAGRPGTGIDDLFGDPGRWLTTMFNTALVALGRETTDSAVGFMGWLLGNGNVISQTPGPLSYDSAVVNRLWQFVRLIANFALAVVTVWGGVNIMVHPQIRAPYHGALELIPRVVLGAALVNTSLYWGQFVIDLNNRFCAELGAAPMPAWDSVLHPNQDSPLMNLIATMVYLVMGLLLLGQMLMRLALVDVLLVIAPLALLCWVLPQTYSWARLWFNTFFATVFVQSIQVLVLHLGSGLITQLPQMLQTIGTDPVDNGRTWLVTLLLAVAVLQLARTVPRLMPGYPGGGGAAVGGAAGLGAMRQIAAFIRVNGQRGAR
jgi:hypothetical protein